MAKRPRDLVIVMAGDNSLHPRFVEGREFDLWVVYYGGSDAVAEAYQKSADRFWRRQGLKIDLVRQVLLEEVYFGEQNDYSAYRYVFLPDDDILFEKGAADIHELFATAEALNADMFQPAIANEYASFNATLRMAGAACHTVNWIENMMPGYTSALFRQAFLGAIHAIEYFKSGWGVELTAFKLAETTLGRGVRAFVIDSCPVQHTRPVGQSSVVHEIGWDEHFLMPQLGANQMRTLVGYRTVEAAVSHTKDAKPLPRNKAAIELYMQKTRFARKLWANLIDR